MQLIREEVKSTLENLILGKEFPPYSCCCGGIKVGKSVAVSIVTPEKDEHVKSSMYWSVKIRELGKSKDCPYSEPLSSFLSEGQIREVFSKAD